MRAAGRSWCEFPCASASALRPPFFLSLSSLALARRLPVTHPDILYCLSHTDDDSVPGFAPSLKTMLSSFSGDAQAAKTGFCGLWADVYSPKTGSTTKLMIADAFDDTCAAHSALPPVPAPSSRPPPRNSWVLTPASIDVIYGSFSVLFGSSTDDKKDVVKDVSWTLTGGRDDRFVPLDLFGLSRSRTGSEHTL